MSIEARITVQANFAAEDQAREATAELEKSLERTAHDLAAALHVLHPIENQSSYTDQDINVEDISLKKKLLTLSAYTYTSEEPTWFAPSLAKLGARRIFIRGSWDGNVRNFYFLDGQKVSKKQYEDDKPKEPKSKADLEIEESLFLPEGRAHVKATLVDHWDVGDMYESVMMEFATEDGQQFFHKATGQLKQLTNEGSSKECEFTAAFERGKLNGKHVSFAKRPTKVSMDAKWKKREVSERTYTSEPAGEQPIYDTVAKCPFCRSALRSEKAKQCPSCFKSWRETE